jgi:ArsR family transcriptional regulator
MERIRQFKAEIFQGLAHPTRIAIVELLREGELTTGQIVETLGLEQANASQHLSVLRAKHIVIKRKVGNQAFYSLRDPILIDVLEMLKAYLSTHLSDHLTALSEIQP